MLNGKRGRFLHRSDPDGVIVDARYHLVTFESLDAAEQYAVGAGLTYHQGEGAHYDLDAIDDWCRSPSASTVDCDTFINVWNLLNDICLTVPWLVEPFRRGHYNVVYNKLFWGLNLPAMTPEGRHWTPIWRESQVRALRRVLTRTVLEFRRLLPGESYTTA
jgi:hypothetical protein